MALISVIIPVYNKAPWLGACLQSILLSAGDALEQLEIILVDDGSTDGSGEICRDYARRYPQIQLLEKPNGGVASARNRGLSRATGAYIAWVDPDDLVDPEWFPALWETIKTHNPDVIVMDTLRFGMGEESPMCYGRPAGLLSPEIFLADVARDKRILGGMPDKVIRRRFFAGMKFDERLPILEDFDLILQVLQPVRKVYYINRPLYRYRQLEESLVHQVSEERAFLSVQVAMKRQRSVPEALQKPATVAVALQILAFFWNRSRFPGAFCHREYGRACRKFLRRHMAVILKDKELTFSEKRTLLLMSCGGYEAAALVKKFLG